MRTSRLPVLALLVASSVAAAAQPKTPGVEIGFRSGWARTTTKEAGFTDKLSVTAVPTALFGPVSGVHVTFFTSPRFALEPQFSMVRVKTDIDTFSVLMLAAQGMFFLGPDAEHAPYIFGQSVTVQTDNSGGSSQSQNGFGAGVGLRQVVRKSLGLRYELRFQHRSGSGQTVDEVALLFGMGTVLGQ